MTDGALRDAAQPKASHGDDVAGTDGNLGTAASVTVAESTVTAAIDGLDEPGGLGF